MGAPWQPRGPDDLDPEQRARIRRRVLSRVRPGRAGLLDHTYAAVALLAAPAPHVARAVVSVGLVVAVVASATVASAEALPNEPLYGVKVASEQVRLALARAPADRAAVELSMAEHRLMEAERLALDGREPDALVATSEYGTHLANAAAELAAVERLEPAARPVVDQLTQRLAEQQRHAADVVTRLAAEPASAPLAAVFRAVASAAPSGDPLAVAEAIAQHAASVTGQLAAVADRSAEAAAERAQEKERAAREEVGAPAQPKTAPRPAETVRASGAPARATAAAPKTEPAQAAAAPTVRPAEVAPVVRGEATSTPRPSEDGSPELTARPTAKPAAQDRAKQEALEKATRDAEKAREAAVKVKQEAEKARAAAEKAKDAAKKTATPKPTPRR